MKRTTGVHMARTLAAGAATCGLLLSLGALAGCRSGSDEAPARIQPPPLLYVTPRAVEVTAGRGAVTFTALLRGVNGPVDWALEPPGVGTLWATSGPSVSYVPPETVTAPATVTLTARVAGLSDRAAIVVSPPAAPAAPALTVTPPTACVFAGGGPTTFAARLENAGGVIAWSLEPAGEGTLSAASGERVEYVPPAAQSLPAVVTVVASAAGLRASATVGVAAQAPGGLPSVATLAPERSVAGGPPLSLTVDGAGFAPGTTVRWNGVDRPTTLVTCTRVVAAVPQADVARPGTAQVSVVNPDQAGSNARVFAIDRRLVARVDVATSGAVAEPGSASVRPVTSADGRFVAFSSTAGNLVPGDGHPNGEVFLRDTCFGAPPGCVPRTERISALAQYPLHVHEEPAITPDARFVAFAHWGPLVSPVSVDISDSGIYVQDTCRGAPPGCSPGAQKVSLPADGWTPVPSAGGGRWTGSPAISADGRFVAFVSAWSLVPEDPPASEFDVYVRDTCRGAPPGCVATTTLASVDPLGSPGVYPFADWNRARPIGISGDGRYVSFLASSGWLVPDDTNGLVDMFVRDTCAGAPAGCLPKTRRVSVGDRGQQGSGSTYEGAMSASGRFAVFASDAPDLVPGDVNGHLDVFLRDTCAGAPPGCTPTTELVSIASDGTPGDGASSHPEVSADGRLVVFASWATNLVPGDTNGIADVFLRDTCRGAGANCVPSTIRLPLPADGDQASPAYWTSRSPTISSDGRAVVLASASYGSSGNLLDFRISLVATCADPSSPGCGPSGALRVNTATTGADVDPDGYLIRLHRTGTDSWDAAAVSAQGASDVFALPPDAYEVTLAGVAANCDPVAPARATITIAPGQTAEVAFSVACSPSTPLAFQQAVPGQAGTALVRVSSNGTGALPIQYDGFRTQRDPAWRPHGPEIAFTSGEPGSVCWGTPAFVDDPVLPYLQVGATCLAEPVAAYQASWSPDGTRLAFVSERDGDPEIYLVAADWTGPVRLTSDPAADLHPAWSPDGTRIAFARSDAAGSRIWVMGADGSGAALLTSDQAEETTPAWSPDGTRIAYSRRVCRDGAAGRECAPWDVYVRDASGTAGAVALGSPLADALDPAWSPDGRKIAYSHRLRDLAAGYHDLSAIAVVRVDGSGPGLADPLRDEFIFGLGARPAWSR